MFSKTTYDTMALVGGAGLLTGFVGGAYMGVIPVLQESGNWAGFTSEVWGAPESIPSFWKSFTKPGVTPAVSAGEVGEAMNMRLTYMFNLAGDLLASKNPNWFDNSETPQELGYPMTTLGSIPLAYYFSALLAAGLIGRLSYDV